MKGNQIKYSIPLILLSCTFLSGCTQPVTEQTTSGTHTRTAMESTPVISYTVPVQTANLLVDLCGYSTEASKTAVVKSEAHFEEEVRVVDAGSGETLQTLSAKEQEYREDIGLYTAEVDFSPVSTEGTYYLENDTVGRSYSFSVEEDFYAERLAEVSEELRGACADSSATPKDVYLLLATYEWYDEMFAAEDGGTPELLDSVAAYLEYEANTAAEEPVTDLYYVAALAKFSYLYQSYQVKYATQCLRHASALYADAAATGKDAERFLALAELYRASGQSSYRNQLASYQEYFADNTTFPQEQGYLFGAMTYLSTRQRVDTELCASLMEGIRSRGEELAKRIEDMIDPLDAHNNGTEELLSTALQLSCANYILSSYQYTELVEDILHYLSGYNLGSELYPITDEERGEELLLLAQLAVLDEG